MQESPWPQTVEGWFGLAVQTVGAVAVVVGILFGAYVRPRLERLKERLDAIDGKDGELEKAATHRDRILAQVDAVEEQAGIAKTAAQLLERALDENVGRIREDFKRDVNGLGQRLDLTTDACKAHTTQVHAAQEELLRVGMEIKAEATARGALEGQVFRLASMVEKRDGDYADIRERLARIEEKQVALMERLSKSL